MEDHALGPPATPRRRLGTIFFGANQREQFLIVTGDLDTQGRNVIAGHLGNGIVRRNWLTTGIERADKSVACVVRQVRGAHRINKQYRETAS
jgi:hypothetical protein